MEYWNSGIMTEEYRSQKTEAFNSERLFNGSHLSFDFILFPVF
jgi:protein tyrosine/serine phosphatase